MKDDERTDGRLAAWIFYLTIAGGGRLRRCRLRLDLLRMNHDLSRNGALP
ncbi:MAG: hypothetical protein M5U28_01315 [Sandaracinaceae bacterium]|nr:hypothetical protein [Sandaracinaceae bacterium]